MNIFYIITIVLLNIIFMLIHKTEKKQNIIAWVAISSILTICYNIFICLIYTLVGAICTLANLTVFNLIIIVILSSIILRNKKVQKYYFKVSDFIYALLVLVLVIIIAYNNYDFPFNIKYQITDGSTHYFFAEQFYKNSTLLYNEKTTDYLNVYNADYRLPGAYVNEGILFKVFDKIILHIDIFILFDLFILYLSGILFYFLLKEHLGETTNKSILTICFSIIYMLGYQLNNMLYGFVYLSLVLDIIIAFLLIMQKYQKGKISDKIALPILSLLSFGIFFSYAYFIPIIYISIIIYTIIKALLNKEKIITPKNTIEIIYMIIIPAILGIVYFIIFPLLNGKNTEISTIGAEGGIYKNLITNYLPFIPIIVTTIIIKIKNKENIKSFSISKILFITSILFTIILGIGNRFGMVSEYYFYKAYNIIWLLTILNTFIMIINIIESKYKKIKIITYTYIVTYIIVTISFSIVFKTNIGINNIFYTNNIVIQDEEELLNREEIKFIENQLREEMYVLGGKYIGRMQWESVLCDNQKTYIDAATSQQKTIDKWLEEKQYKYYFALYKDYNDLEYNKLELDENNNSYKILYEDKTGFVLERK